MNTLLADCLADLEARIDPAVEDALYQAWVDFLDGRFTGNIFSPSRPGKSLPRIAWPKVSVNAAMEDYDQMLLHQFRGCSDMLEAGNGLLLAVRSNYGVSILPSLFGVELFYMPEETNTLPTSKPLPGPDAVKALLARGVPDLQSGLGARTLEAGRRFAEIMRAYPRLRRCVHLYHPDLQGPIDACEVLWGSRLFLDLVDEPDLVKAFLELITETYVRFMRAWEEIAPCDGDYAVHWSLLHKGRIMLRDDSVMNLSPAMYDEFVRPYDQRLLDELGGGALHFCGRGDHYIASAARMRGLTALALSQPEYNDMEVIYRHTVDRGIKLLSLPRAAAEQALARGRSLRHSVHCA